MNPVSKILLGIGAVVALAVAIIIVWLSLANAHLRAELAETRVNVTACEIANDDFRQKTEKQNQTITQMKTDGAERERAGRIAVQNARKSAAGFQSDAGRIAKQKSSGDDCKAAAALLNDYIAGIK